MRLAGILLCVILVLLGIGYWYYSSSQAKISALTFNNAKLDKLRDHDIGLLGEAKPALVERIIDRASAKALRCFELLSGAELTTTERNAKNENAFNSECPWLYNDLVISNELQP